VSWDLPVLYTNIDVPGFKFVRPIFHPNIYEDGKLCISILHPPGDDDMSGELASERWSCVQGIESVLISILSLLDDAEVSSPANVDAGVMLRKEPELYKARVKEDVEASKKDIPEGFIMPTHETTKPPVAEKYDDDFWADSDAGESFGGSDSDPELNHDDDEEEEDNEEVEERGESDGEGYDDEAMVMTMTLKTRTKVTAMKEVQRTAKETKQIPRPPMRQTEAT
jgi:ubiquitin-conjugating enzyme E2 R